MHLQFYFSYTPGLFGGKTPEKESFEKALNSLKFVLVPVGATAVLLRLYPMEGLAPGLSSSGVPGSGGVTSSGPVSPGRVDMAYTLPQHDELEQVCGDTSFFDSVYVAHVQTAQHHRPQRTK